MTAMRVRRSSVTAWPAPGSPRAARAGRRRPKVTVLGAEPHRAYNRILLSTLLAGKIGEAGRGADRGRRARRRRCARGVTGRPPIDRAARDGAAPTTASASATTTWCSPPAAGRWCRRSGPRRRRHLPERVAAVPHPGRLPADPRRWPTAPARALVLGGGLLGLEAARGLAARGLAVTVRARRRAPDGAPARPGRRRGARAARWPASASRSQLDGAGDRRRAADADGVDAVDLADGRRSRADLLVVACGVRPETGLAAQAGLAVERGIVVDDRLRTSDPRISAIGDCAEHDGVRQRAGRAGLGAGPGGRRRADRDRPLARYRPRPAVTRLKAAGIDLAAMGDCDPTADRRGADLRRPGPGHLRQARDPRTTG